MSPQPASSTRHLGEVARLFLRLGFTAFGGPAAHIAMMRDEVVKRRQWVSDQHFLDMLGATNLIPGPNSTEMTIHLGYVRAGWPGLIVAGTCFILPAMIIVTGLAWLYVTYRSLPQVDWLLYGIKPVIIVVIAQALVGLGRKALKGPLTAIVGAVTLGLYFLGVSEIGLLFAGGLSVMLIENARRWRAARVSAWPLAWLGLNGAATALASTPITLPLLFGTFLKIGAVLYGSGYVLLAFMRGDFVARLGWLTDQQLLDAIAIGQVTPGPVFTTATFVGYVLGQVPGAILATIAIFLPAFVLVAISNPFIPRLRQSPWASGLLDGVNVTSLGLMAAVTFQLGQAALIDPLTVGVAAVAAVLHFRFRVNATWLVLGGAAIGLLVSVVH
jgi:chromate transporter